MDDRVEISPLVAAHAEELATFVLRGRKGTKRFTPAMESLAYTIQTAIERWLIKHRGWAENEKR